MPKDSATQLNGLYTGTVMQVADDPDKQERIMVHIPLLHEEDQGVWARAASLYAGSGHAVGFRPEKGDEVLLGFPGGDPDAPVIIGSLPPKTNPLPDRMTDKDKENSCKGWVSKNGLTLLLNEKDKSITLETPGRQSIYINDETGEVALKDKYGNSIQMNKDGIKLKSGKDILLEAAGNATIQAKGNFSSRSLQSEVTADTSLKLSGQAAAELKAGGMVTVKGALVTIN